MFPPVEALAVVEPAYKYRLEPVYVLSVVPTERTMLPAKPEVAAPVVKEIDPLLPKEFEPVAISIPPVPVPTPEAVMEDELMAMFPPELEWLVPEVMVKVVPADIATLPAVAVKVAVVPLIVTAVAAVMSTKLPGEDIERSEVPMACKVLVCVPAASTYNTEAAGVREASVANMYTVPEPPVLPEPPEM